MAGDLQAAAVERLAEQDLRIVGRFVEATNLTLLAELADGRRAVVKPVAGERPLWDFPDGTLAGREVASWLVCRALGWDLVPATVLRDVPEAGPSSVQEYVDGQGEPVVDLFRGTAPDGWAGVAAGVDEDGAEVVIAHRDTPALRRMAVLDVLLNNADRKGSHILVAPDGRVRGIDHGLTFHAQDKLRTVLWGFAGDPLPADVADALEQLRAQWPPPDLELHLTGREVRAAGARLQALLGDPRYPLPAPGWPRLPWPPL